MPSEKLPTTHPTETATTRIRPEEAIGPLLQELLNSSHNWERLAARPHTPAHREIEDEIGQSVALGFGEMSPALKEAVAVSAELGDLAVPPPRGKMSRLRQFFRLGRKRSATSALSPIERSAALVQEIAETIPIFPPSGVTEYSGISTESTQDDSERDHQPKALMSYAERLESVINKAASEQDGTPQSDRAMQDVEAAMLDILWFPSGELQKMLNSGSYTPRELSAFLDAARHAIDFAPEGHRQKLAPEAGAHPQHNYSDVLSLLNHVPAETLRSAYFSPSDSERGNLRYILKANGAHKSPSVAYGVIRELSRIHGCSTGELFRPGVVDSDSIVQSIARREDLHRVMLESIPIFPDHRESNSEFTTRVRRSEAEYLNGLGLPGELVHRIRQAIDSRTMAKDKDGNVLTGGKRVADPEAVRDLLSKFGENVQAIGLENILKLSEACGIVDLNCYSHDQLERMLKFSRGDKELIADLQAGDTTVVFIDRRGDHNGSGVDFAANIEKPSGRTLFFEINKPEDFRQNSRLLLRNRVKPSTVVMAAHGSPGQMYIGDIFADGFILTNADSKQLQETQGGDGINRVALQAEGKFLESFVRNVMQESRGIDDDPDNVGRRLAVLVACSQAIDREITRDGIVERASTASVLAELIAGSKVKEPVDIYAADRVVADTPTVSGIRYQEVGAGGGAVDAHVFTAGGGEVTRSQVAEIKLRRVPTGNEARAA